MIPMIDDYLQFMIASKLAWLKKHPSVIDHIFHACRRETALKLKDFIENRKIKVIIGYPREQNSLPAYVITLAPESEQYIGLGDDSGFYEGYDIGGLGDTGDEFEENLEEEMSKFISGTYMNSNYRIECWSDNGDLTSFMYIILKWCLWGSRQEMLNMGWVNIRLNGTDLEPVPDYMPIFIYRRAAQLSITYENLYYEDIEEFGKYLDVIEHPEDYHPDDDGNLVDGDGNIVIPAKFSWIIKSTYYAEKTGDIMSINEFIYTPEPDSE